MKKICLALTILFVTACTTKQQSPVVNPRPTIPQTSTTDTTQPSSTATSSARLSETFTSDLYTIKYRKDLKAEKMNATSSRIYKSGPTQKGQTEMYDGIIVSLDTVENTKNQTLMTYVKEKIAEEKNHGEVTVEPKEITINGTMAIQYRFRGLGEHDTYVLETKDKKAFITISVLAEDPTNVGFKQLAVDIVNSIMVY